MGTTRVPPVLADVDVAFPGQAPEDLPNRRTRKAVALAQDHLIQILVGFEFHGQDLALKVVVQAVLGVLHEGPPGSLSQPSLGSPCLLRGM